MYVGGETDEPNRQQGKQFAQANGQGAAAAIAAGAIDRRFAGQAARREGGDKRGPVGIAGASGPHLWG